MLQGSQAASRGSWASGTAHPRPKSEGTRGGDEGGDKRRQGCYLLHCSREPSVPQSPTQGLVCLLALQGEGEACADSPGSEWALTNWRGEQARGEEWRRLHLGPELIVGPTLRPSTSGWGGSEALPCLSPTPTKEAARPSPKVGDRALVSRHRPPGRLCGKQGVEIATPSRAADSTPGWPSALVPRASYSHTGLILWKSVFHAT